MFLEVFILALALSMDAFAVSVGLGSKLSQNRRAFAIKAALLFGFFQAFMPLIGFLAGIGLESFIKEFDHWIAFILLVFIGAKMIYESFEEEIEDSICKLSNKLLLSLAIATSIDAMAAGFTLALFELHFLISIAIIGIVTFFMSFIGVYIGAKGSKLLESKAEFLGGFVLIIIGFKILFEHLGLL